MPQRLKQITIIGAILIAVTVVTIALVPAHVRLKFCAKHRLVRLHDWQVRRIRNAEGPHIEALYNGITNGMTRDQVQSLLGLCVLTNFNSQESYVPSLPLRRFESPDLWGCIQIGFADSVVTSKYLSPNCRPCEDRFPKELQ
jgi:hypothetical protein